MLAIPQLAGVPAEYTTAEPNRLAAQLALALAGGKMPFARRPSLSPELDALQRHLQAWVDRMNAQARFIPARVHVALDTVGQHHAAIEDHTYTVWIGGADGNHCGPIWTLERKWRALEAKAPGLVAAALHAVWHAGRHAFPVFVPAVAEEWGCYQYWHGEMDESEVLEEYRAEIGDPKAKPPEEMLTRAWFDKALPPFVCNPQRGRARGKNLQRYARRGGEVGAIARQVLELEAECQAAHRRKSEFEFESQDDNGFQAIGFSTCLRWNNADPMTRIFDDYVNEAYQCEGVESAFGWFVMEEAEDLPRLFAELEHYFRLLRKIERLIPLIASRGGQ